MLLKPYKYYILYTMDDPCINLLNIDSFYERINSSLKHRKPNYIDTDFVVEPWDDNSGNRDELQT